MVVLSSPLDTRPLTSTFKKIETKSSFESLDTTWISSTMSEASWSEILSNFSSSHPAKSNPVVEKLLKIIQNCLKSTNKEIFKSGLD